MNRITCWPEGILPIGSLLGAALLLSIPTGLTAQRGTKTIGLAAPSVRVHATPLTVTVAWQPVRGAVSYTVEWATSPSGPWTPIPVDPRAGSQVTMPSIAGPNWTGLGGALYYYRVTAVPEFGDHGVTVVPRVTPPLDAPTGVDVWQEGPDARITWVPVPFATGYVVTVAPGQQLPPSQSVEVSAQQSEARLVNLGQVGVSIPIWVAVNARYGTAGVTSMSKPRRFLLADVQYCWSPSALPGPAPTVLVSAGGPTSVSLTSTGAQAGQGSMRVERAAVGSPVWQSVGCGNYEVADWSLAPGTQYQYRVFQNHPTGSVGQTVVMATTPSAPDSPPVTATIGGCTTNGCPVALNWNHAAGAHEYRIESSYGLYRAVTNQMNGGEPAGTPLSVQLGTVPAGVHTFFVTPLFIWQRPSPKPPAQVTVTVP